MKQGTKLFLSLQKLSPAYSVYESMLKSNKIKAMAIKLKKGQKLIKKA